MTPEQQREFVAACHRTQQACHDAIEELRRAAAMVGIKLATPPRLMGEDDAA